MCAAVPPEVQPGYDVFQMCAPPHHSDTARDVVLLTRWGQDRVRLLLVLCYMLYAVPVPVRVHSSADVRARLGLLRSTPWTRSQTFA